MSSLDTIATSKDAQRDKQLCDFAQNALAAIKEHDPELPDPEIVFAPLQLAAKTGSVLLVTTALDCIGKLISYSSFVAPNRRDASPAAVIQQAPLIERAIDAICDCFQGEATPIEIQLQIVKSLLAAVLNDKIVVHGAGLLKAVRQVYNVFLLSRNTANQQVAQGTLMQMVGTVFERVKIRLHMKEARMNLSKLRHGSSNVTFDPADSISGAVADGTESPDVEEGANTPTEQTTKEAKLTLKDLEHRKSFDDSNIRDGPTMVTHLAPSKMADKSPSEQPEESAETLESEDEVYIRDAYLVFRSFCNLSTKKLTPDQLYDIRSQPMRSKLLSLHIIQALLNNHINVFTSSLCTIKSSKSNEPTPFLQAIKFYLCFSITQNGASPVDKIFEVCCEIFWLMLKFLRPNYKVNPLRLSLLFSPNCKDSLVTR